MNVLSAAISQNLTRVVETNNQISKLGIINLRQFCESFSTFHLKPQTPWMS